jgi:hypothetical protein
MRLLQGKMACVAFPILMPFAMTSILNFQIRHGGLVFQIRHGGQDISIFKSSNHVEKLP